MCRLPAKIWVPVVLIASVWLAHYQHWDNRLLQLFKELRTPEQQQERSIWLADYSAVIQAKPIPQLKEDETSGLTWHEPTNTLFAVTGKITKLAQLSLTGDLIREIELHGFSDLESVEALSDGRLAVMDERQSILTIFSLPVDNVIEQSEQFAVDLKLLAVDLLDPKNKGVEGIAWDERNSRFLLAKERDPYGLFALDFDLDTNTLGHFYELPSDQLFMRDLSGLAMDKASGHLLVLSDDSSMLLELDIQGNPISFMSLFPGLNGLNTGIQQAEGVAIDKQGSIYIVGEPNLFYRFEPVSHQ